jgi:transposase
MVVVSCHCKSLNLYRRCRARRLAAALIDAERMHVSAVNIWATHAARRRSYIFVDRKPHRSYKHVGSVRVVIRLAGPLVLEM